MDSYMLALLNSLKGPYDAILKIIILCIWCSRICCHADTVMMLVCICSTQAAVKKADVLWFLMGCTLRCDVTLLPSNTHTHTHTTNELLYTVQNSAFEQSIANNSTNNKTYLQSLIQKHQIVIANSETDPFF